jgi:hypothetical protein
MDRSELIIRLAQAGSPPDGGAEKSRNSTPASPAAAPGLPPDDALPRGTDGSTAVGAPVGSGLPAAKSGGGEAPAKESSQPKAKGDSKTEFGTAPRESSKPGVTHLPSQPKPPEFDWYQPSVLIAVAVCVAAIGVALSLLRTKPVHRNGVDVARLTREIGAALHKPGLPLEQVSSEIERIETGTANLVAAYEDLKEANRKAALRAGNPLRKRIDAAIFFLEDSISAGQRLADHTEFSGINQVLAVQDGYEAAAKALSELPDGDWLEAALLTALERGDFNVALTFPSFIEAYFPDQRDWRQLRIAAGAGEAALQSLLAHQGFQMLMTPILSIISAADIREPPTTDIRNVRTIPEVQKLAARMARDLGNREFLIVDCHTPGWISEKHGRRAPQFTVFDPASWT